MPDFDSADLAHRILVHFAHVAHAHLEEVHAAHVAAVPTFQAGNAPDLARQQQWAWHGNMVTRHKGDHARGKALAREAVAETITPPELRTRLLAGVPRTLSAQTEWHLEAVAKDLADGYARSCARGRTDDGLAAELKRSEAVA